MSDEAAETIQARAAVIICETGAVCNNGANPNCRSREVAAALFDAGLLCAPITVTDEMVERAAAAICKSGRYETGEGTCALACMDQLGVARNGCRHAIRIHGNPARAALTAALEGKG